MKRTTALLAGGGIFLLLTIFFSCQREVTPGDDGNTGKTKLSIYLADGPLDFQHVYVDIQRIDVKLDTCRRHDDDDDHHGRPGCDDDHDSISARCEIWDTLDIVPGVYDLLTLRNGVDTLLASGFILNGKIERVKFTLGNNNSVVVDSVTHPLHLLNNQHFVYVDIKKDHVDVLTNNNLRLFLDFDLARSIKFINGQYWLKPKLKPFGRHSSGEIEGKVRPPHSFGIIKAFNAADTVFALPHDEGEFKIRGLREGIYSLFIDGINGYRDSTINNIVVRRNKETELNTIFLRQ